MDKFDLLANSITRTEDDLRALDQKMTAGFIRVDDGFLRMEDKIDGLTNFKWKAIGIVTGVSCFCSVIVTLITLFLKFGK